MRLFRKKNQSRTQRVYAVTGLTSDL